MNHSDSEDEPRNSSDEEWTPERQRKKINVLRKSVRLIKKARTYASSEDDASTHVPKVQRNGVKKKRGYNRRSIPETTRPPIQAPITFTSGAFVVAKNDAQCYDSGVPPHIWRIDGKALLQKFEPITEDNVLKYKNTSVYTGWSEIETDNYAVLKNITFIYNTPQRVEITLSIEEFKNILMESE